MSRITCARKSNIKLTIDLFFGHKTEILALSYYLFDSYFIAFVLSSAYSLLFELNLSLNISSMNKMLHRSRHGWGENVFPVCT